MLGGTDVEAPFEQLARQSCGHLIGQRGERLGRLELCAGIAAGQRLHRTNGFAIRKIELIDGIVRGLQRLLSERHVEFVADTDAQPVLRDFDGLLRVRNHLQRDLALQSTLDCNEPRLRQRARERLSRSGKICLRRHVGLLGRATPIPQPTPHVHFPSRAQQHAGRTAEVAAELAAAFSKCFDNGSQAATGSRDVRGGFLNACGREPEIRVVCDCFANELLEVRIAEGAEPWFGNAACAGNSLPHVRYDHAR